MPPINRGRMVPQPMFRRGRRRAQTVSETAAADLESSVTPPMQIASMLALEARAIIMGREPTAGA